MNVIPIKGAQAAPSSQRSRMETLLLTPDQMQEWEKPPFQRLLKVNDKVKSIAEELKHNGGTITGIITLGIVPNDKNHYLLDGQHRREAAIISGLPEFIVDVRVMKFDNMAEMAEEFVRLNTAIVKMQPDDVLRGLEPSLRPLQIIRQKCPFVGYAYIRTGGRGGYQLGMSATLRCWSGSEKETPGVTGGKSATVLAAELSIESAEELSKFLGLLMSAWGKDMENARLWSNLNLTMCMWLWRVMVIDRARGGAKRYATLTTEQFKHCLMALAASNDYVEFLVGRQMNDRDRSPTYRRIKLIFADRLKHEGADSLRFPSPSWAKN
jgi:hypothetical protein